jgi:hypothetical protein
VVAPSKVPKCPGDRIKVSVRRAPWLPCAVSRVGLPVRLVAGWAGRLRRPEASSWRAAVRGGWPWWW